MSITAAVPPATVTTVTPVGTPPVAAAPVLPRQREEPDRRLAAQVHHDLADVALVGLGYVGLPTALAFHAAGSTVIGLDASAARRSSIADGSVDLLPSDHRRLAEALQDPARFTVSADPGRLQDAGAVIVAVPTPVDDHLQPDLSILRAACRTVVEHAVAGQVIILTSTTYVGSTEDLLVRPLRERGLEVGTDLHVAFSPERIDPGNDRHAHEDVPRVVGGVTEACTYEAMRVLGTYAAKLHPVSSPAAAEMTKLFENTFRAVNIALANEVADITRSLHLDVLEIVEAAATKPYGFMPFYPGPGVGGHCIPCDPHYLLWQLKSLRQHPPVISSAMTAIAARPAQVVERVQQVLSAAGRGMRGSSVTVVGVTYKPDVEDVRESPALEIIDGLRRYGVEVGYHDPLVPVLTCHDGTVLHSQPASRAAEVDLVLLHTAHDCLEPAWVERPSLLLDATYRLPAGPTRWTV
ncbi:nucleotide sugar dehydrogenase [Nocardioides aurantiacus]|uniref:nucleotide sugar dehydrogenase n=1 Tax=Nocardioides aurantiacus TaxID=86796 RepID=UPI00403F3554